MSELDYMDALAAEYVLGTLDVEERTQARSLLEADEAFAAKVRLWERRFGDLHLMVEPVEPDSAIWARIRAKMSEVRQQIRAPQPVIPPPAPETTAAQPASVTVAEPPSLDAIEAAIAQAATTLSAEANSVPQSEATRARSEATPPVSELPPAESEATSPLSETPPAESEATPPVSEVPPAGSEATPPVSELPPSGSELPPSGSELPPAGSDLAPPVSEAPPAGSEVTPTSVSEATPASEPTSAPVSDAPPAPPEATRTSAAEAALTPPAAAVAAAAAAEAPSDTQAQAAERVVFNVHRQLRRWRAFAIAMTLVVVAVAALLAAWRFAPDRVPSMLQPLELMRQIGVTLPGAQAPRRPAPPESQFDE